MDLETPSTVQVAYIGNQGGRDLLAFYGAIDKVMRQEYASESRFAVWLESEKAFVPDEGTARCAAFSLQEFVRKMSPVTAADVDGLVRQYREVNWSEVVASERAFTDYSMLLGSAGDRREDGDYVGQLLVSIVRFLEHALAGCQAMVCQTADTLFSLAAFKVAAHMGIQTCAIAPAWLLEPGKGGGFFASSPYLECRAMAAAFARRQGTVLTSEERSRVDALIGSIRGFEGKTAYSATTSKGSGAGRQALSPQAGRLLDYLAENARRDKRVEYIKIDPMRKVRANLLRIYRKQVTRGSFGSPDTQAIPSKAVFYPLHYQPEQSTLAQGIWYANQVALVENISKALPLGYTLVVKEHPWGRGNRPRWQYEHMAGFPNVILCDAPAREIIQRVEAVVVVSGTVAMESLVFDKPTVMLGRNFFEISDLIYRVRDIQDLPEILARILVDGDYAKQTNRGERLHCFLMAYLEGLVPYFPLPEHAGAWARALAREIGVTTS